MPVLRELQSATSETTTVSAAVARGRVYLDQVESSQEIKMTVEIGRRFPFHAGSTSACILAFLPPDEQRAVLTGPLDRLTERTVTDRATLTARLARIRSIGQACSDGERRAGAAT